MKSLRLDPIALANATTLISARLTWISILFHCCMIDLHYFSIRDDADECHQRGVDRVSTRSDAPHLCYKVTLQAVIQVVVLCGQALVRCPSWLYNSAPNDYDSGTGVILSTVFIHLLYHSFVMFGNAWSVRLVLPHSRHLTHVPSVSASSYSSLSPLPSLLPVSLRYGAP